MQKATVFKTTLLLFLLSQASPAAFAQQDETARTTPYRIGVLPFEVFDPSTHWGSGEVTNLTAGAVQTVVDGHPVFVRTYSFYDSTLNAPRLRKANKLWAGNRAKKEPVVSLVSRAGRERNVDAVLMCWLHVPFGYTYQAENRVPLEVYLIDVDSQKVYRAKGAQKDTTKLVGKVLAAFVAGRGDKLDMAAVAAAETPAQIQEKTRSAPYQFGVFPFEAIGYGDWATNEAVDITADALQTFVDGHPSLVLAYSYFDRMLNEPRLRKVNKLWAGERANKKPVVSLVSAAGRERNVDGVLMCWLNPGTGFAYGIDTKVPAEVYLIDVNSHKVYRAQGNAMKAHVMLDEVVSQFLDDHPKVVP